MLRFVVCVSARARAIEIYREDGLLSLSHLFALCSLLPLCYLSPPFSRRTHAHTYTLTVTFRFRKVYLQLLAKMFVRNSWLVLAFLLYTRNFLDGAKFCVVFICIHLFTLLVLFAFLWLCRIILVSRATTIEYDYIQASSAITLSL